MGERIAHVFSRIFPWRERDANLSRRGFAIKVAVAGGAFVLSTAATCDFLTPLEEKGPAVDVKAVQDKLFIIGTTVLDPKSTLSLKSDNSNPDSAIFQKNERSLQQSITLEFIPKSEHKAENVIGVKVEDKGFQTKSKDPKSVPILQDQTIKNLSLDNHGGQAVGVFNEDIQAVISGKSKSMVEPFFYLTEPHAEGIYDKVKPLTQNRLDDFVAYIQKIVGLPQTSPQQSSPGNQIS